MYMTLGLGCKISICVIYIVIHVIYEETAMQIVQTGRMHTQMGQKYDRIGQEKMTYQKKHSEMDNQ